jgi:hypothetical protein
LRAADIDERGGQAGGERVQEVLGGVGAGIRAEQDGGLAGVDDERLLARRVLLAGAVELLDRRAVVRAGDPVVAGSELEAAQLRLGLDRVQRPVHLLRVDSIADRVDRRGHCGGAPWPWLSVCGE